MAVRDATCGVRAFTNSRSSHCDCVSDVRVLTVTVCAVGFLHSAHVQIPLHRRAQYRRQIVGTRFENPLHYALLTILFKRE